MLKSAMAMLDNDDFKAMKDLMQVTIDEVVESRGLVTKDEFYKEAAQRCRTRFQSELRPQN
jgi:hypothetical protein